MDVDAGGGPARRAAENSHHGHPGQAGAVQRGVGGVDARHGGRQHGVQGGDGDVEGGGAGGGGRHCGGHVCNPGLAPGGPRGGGGHARRPGPKEGNKCRGGGDCAERDERGRPHRALFFASILPLSPPPCRHVGACPFRRVQSAPPATPRRLRDGGRTPGARVLTRTPPPHRSLKSLPPPLPLPPPQLTLTPPPYPLVRQKEREART